MRFALFPANIVQIVIFKENLCKQTLIFARKIRMIMSQTEHFGIFAAGKNAVLFPEDEGWRTPIGRVHFILIMQGGAMVHVDGHDLLLHEGSFVFLLPNMMVRGQTHTDDFRYEYLFFDFDFMADLPLLIKADISYKAIYAPQRNLEPRTASLIDRYFGFIGERHAQGPENTEIIKGLLFSLILEVNRLYAERYIPIKVSRLDELTDNFFRLLHLYYKEEHSAAFYADKLCVSDKHLMRTVKRKTGRTFHFWLSDFLLREAKQQLKSTDKSITEISDELHFPNSSFFARFFRKHEGMSPLQFRKSN